MGKITHRSQRVNALQSITDALTSFMNKRGGLEHLHLTRLWEHWEMVMGHDLAALARPLGHKKDVLLIAAEDSMAAQDIAMQATEVLERANAFMNESYFSRIQVELAMRRKDLSAPMPTMRPAPPEYQIARPKNLGALSGKLDPESPVAQCYEAYLQYFSRIQ